MKADLVIQRVILEGQAKDEKTSKMIDSLIERTGARTMSEPCNCGCKHCCKTDEVLDDEELEIDWKNEG